MIVHVPEDVLGVDLGGVVITHCEKTSTEDTSFFGDNFRETPPVPGAFESIALLRRERFSRPRVISKGGPGTEWRSLRWLEYHKFYKITGIAPEDVHFCRDREGKDILARELGLTHYVDNDPRVLTLMDSVLHRYLFQATAERLRGFTPEDMEKFYPYVKMPAGRFNPLPDWKTTVKAILESPR